MNSQRSAKCRHIADNFWVVLALAMMMPVAARAYIAAGDRDFPATLLVPQLAPSDAFWGTFSTLPSPDGQQTTFEGTYSKTITERLGIQLSDGVIYRSWRAGGDNLDVQIQYELVLDQPQEFILSAQADASIGGTGSAQVGASTQTEYQPAITFGKGFGDVPVELLRPFAVTGFAGYQFTAGHVPDIKPNKVNVGLSLQYSFPYLVSKVTNLALPAMILRDVTPITELYMTDPIGHGCCTSLLVAPGINYSPGNGFEFGIEAEIPATKAAGRGIGVIAQVVVEFDYLFPESILGHPLFH